MIKKFKQPTIYIFFSIIVFMFLLPKELIYKVFEKELSKYEIVISNEIRDENFSLDILNASVFYKGINIAKINRANFMSFLIYSEFNLINIELEEKLKKIIPYEIENISFKHSIFAINKIYINGNSKFGKFEGYVSLFEKVIKIELEESAEIKSSNFIKYFKYDNERYLYEYRF